MLIFAAKIQIFLQDWNNDFWHENSKNNKIKEEKNVKKKWRHFSIQLNANFDFTALSRIATLKAGKLHLELEVNK